MAQKSPRHSPSQKGQASKLRAILEFAIVAIITIDDHGLVVSVNPATERLFGYERRN